MAAPHFNGRAGAELKAQAELLRQQFHNSFVRPSLDELVVDHVRYLRYPDGRFRNEGDGKKELDPKTLFAQQEEGDYPWLHELEPIVPLDFANLSDTPQIDRAWAVPEWFPILETIGFAGPGGEGKTTIAQTFATAAVLGASYLGLPFETMKASLVLCEDRPDDAYLRQTAINRYFRCSNKDLAGQLLILPRRKNRRNYLGIFDRDGVLHTTPWFDQLLAKLKAFGAQFHIIDTRADVFWGNQNDERHARQFVRCITDRIAEETGGLCMLLYQPSRAGRNDGESGSVQWDAAFRSRIMITSPDPEDLTVRQLTRIKSNFSAKGETIELRWNKSGVFLRQEEIDAQTPSYEIAARLNKPRRVFLNLLDKFTKQNRPVSEAVSSPNYAPKAFAAEEAAEGCDSDSLANAMRRLFDAGEIINLAYGPPSRPSRRIVKVVEP